MFPFQIPLAAGPCRMQYRGMAAQHKDWTREEHILAFNLYCKIPFGQIHPNK